uniref:Spen family transcriptional repressor n=1 Tax=Lates calcarifer TaxID=8187 RepID=A0A4W6E0N4_LATCA
YSYLQRERERERERFETDRGPHLIATRRPASPTASPSLSERIPSDSDRRICCRSSDRSGSCSSISPPRFEKLEKARSERYNKTDKLEKDRLFEVERGNLVEKEKRLTRVKEKEGKLIGHAVQEKQMQRGGSDSPRLASPSADQRSPPFRSEPLKGDIPKHGKVPRDKNVHSLVEIIDKDAKVKSKKHGKSEMGFDSSISVDIDRLAARKRRFEDSGKTDRQKRTSEEDLGRPGLHKLWNSAKETDLDKNLLIKGMHKKEHHKDKCVRTVSVNSPKDGRDCESKLCRPFSGAAVSARGASRWLRPKLCDPDKLVKFENPPSNETRDFEKDYVVHDVGKPIQDMASDEFSSSKRKKLENFDFELVTAKSERNFATSQKLNEVIYQSMTSSISTGHFSANEEDEAAPISVAVINKERKSSPADDKFSHTESIKSSLSLTNGNDFPNSLSYILRERDERMTDLKLSGSLEKNKFYSFALDKTITPDTKALLERAKTLYSSREDNWSFLPSRFPTSHSCSDKDKVELAPRPIPSWYMKKKKIRTDSEEKLHNKKEELKPQDQERQELFASRFLHSSIFEQDSRRLQHLERKDQDLEPGIGRPFGKPGVTESQPESGGSDIPQEPIVLFHSRFLELQQQKDKDHTPPDTENDLIVTEIKRDEVQNCDNVLSDKESEPVLKVGDKSVSPPLTLSVSPSVPSPKEMSPEKKEVETPSSDQPVSIVKEEKVEPVLESSPPHSLPTENFKPLAPKLTITPPLALSEPENEMETKVELNEPKIKSGDSLTVEHIPFVEDKPPTPGGCLGGFERETAEFPYTDYPKIEEKSEIDTEPKMENQETIEESQKTETDSEACMPELEAEIKPLPNRRQPKSKRSKPLSVLRTSQPSQNVATEKPAIRKSERIDREKLKRASSPRAEAPKASFECKTTSKSPIHASDSEQTIESSLIHGRTRRRNVRSVYAKPLEDDQAGKEVVESSRSTRKRGADKEPIQQDVQIPSTNARRGRPPKRGVKRGEDASPVKGEQQKMIEDDTEVKETPSTVEVVKASEGWRSPRTQKVQTHLSSSPAVNKKGGRIDKQSENASPLVTEDKSHSLKNLEIRVSVDDVKGLLRSEDDEPESFEASAITKTKTVAQENEETKVIGLPKESKELGVQEKEDTLSEPEVPADPAAALLARQMELEQAVENIAKLTVEQPPRPYKEPPSVQPTILPPVIVEPQIEVEEEKRANPASETELAAAIDSITAEETSDSDDGPLTPSPKGPMTEAKAAEDPPLLETPKKTGKVRAKTPKKSRSRKCAANKKGDPAEDVSQPETSPVKLPESIPEDPETINSKAVTVTFSVPLLRIYVASSCHVTVVTPSVSTAIGTPSTNPPMPPDTKASDIDPSSSTLRKILMEPKYVSASNSNSIPTTIVTSALSDPSRMSEIENRSDMLGSRQLHPEERPPFPIQPIHHKPSPLTESQQNCGEKTQHTIISPATSVISRIPMPYDTEETPRISLSNRSVGLSIPKQKFRSNSNENNRYHSIDIVEDGTRGRSVVETTPYSTGSGLGLRVNTSEGVVVLSYSGQKTEGSHRMRAKISQIPQASAGDIEFQQSVSKSQIKQEPLITSSQSPTPKVAPAHTTYGHTGVLLTGQSYNSQPVISSTKQESLGSDKSEAPYHTSSQGGVVKMFHQPVSSPQVLMYNQAVIQQQHGKRGLGTESKKMDIGKTVQQSNLSPVMSPHHPSLSGTRMSPSPGIPTDRSALHLKQEPQSPRTAVHSPSPFVKAGPPSGSPIGTSVVLGHGMPPMSTYHSSMHHPHSEQSSVIIQPHSVTQSMAHEARMNTPPISGNYGRRGDSLSSPHPGPQQRSNTPQPNVIRDMVLQSHSSPQGSVSGGGSSNVTEEDPRHFNQALSRPSVPQLQSDVMLIHSDHRGLHPSIRMDQYRDMHQRILMHQQLGEQAAVETRQSRTSDPGTTSSSNISGPSKSAIVGKGIELSAKESLKPLEGKLIHPPSNESRIRGVHASSPVMVSPHPHGVQLMHPGGVGSFPVYRDMRGFPSQFPGHPSSGHSLANQGIASSQTIPESKISFQPVCVFFVQKYPIVWQGLLALKNDQAAVQLHFVSGNTILAQRSLPPPEGGSLLRIVQRMRLEASQLDSVARRMTVESDYCLLLALPCGRDQEDVLGQTQALKSGFITYLQAKQAAGIINVPNPGSNQPAYVVQIFPPCEFSESHLSRLAPDLLNSISSISPHLMIVIASV